MTNRYEVIDQEKWKRAIHCQVFRNYVEPSYCVTLELDISHFLQKIKALNYSFTLSMIYVVSKCANEIEAFRYRFLDGQVVLYEKIDTGFTYIPAGDDLFKVVNVKLTDTLEEYLKIAKETAENQKEYFTGPIPNDAFQFSPLPWVSYTHISHTISGKKENASPIFDWGKYFERDGKWMLPFSVQVHHSFADGIHVGQLVNLLQEKLNSVDALF